MRKSCESALVPEKRGDLAVGGFGILRRRLGMVMLGVALAACVPEKPATSPDHNKVTQKEGAKKKHEPRIIAPPPGYGNRIVMADEAGQIEDEADL